MGQLDEKRPKTNGKTAPGVGPRQPLLLGQSSRTADRPKRVHNAEVRARELGHARAIHQRGQFSTGGVTRSDPSRRVPSLCH
jgi:hypothetical protein